MSQNVESPVEVAMETLPEAPLLGLCLPKPVHLMTPQERREHVAAIRSARNNPASWKAQINNQASVETGATQPKGEKKENEAPLDLSDSGLADLLS